MDLDTLKTELLVKQLRWGSELAFTPLYDLYSKQLYRNILRMVKDEDVAQELLQDLFLKIWESQSSIDPEKSFRSFLYKVAENLVYMHFRKLSKDKRLIERLILSANVFENNVEDGIISKETNNLLKQAIEHLSPQMKKVFTLCKLEGKSYEEVSKQLGITTSTVSNHIVKANKAVKRYFLNNQEVALFVIISNLLLHTK
jgi:RNA polymerase sigma-70 factor (ECF subfamily)